MHNSLKNSLSSLKEAEREKYVPVRSQSEAGRMVELNRTKREADYVFTPRGFEAYSKLTRELPTGFRKDEYLCKETYKGAVCPKELFEEFGVKFEGNYLEMTPKLRKEFGVSEEDVLRKGTYLDTETGKDVEVWDVEFYAEGVVRGIGEQALMFRLNKPGHAFQGPQAWARWDEGLATKFMGVIAGREDMEDPAWWFKPECLPKKKIVSQEERRQAEVIKDLMSGL